MGSFDISCAASNIGIQCGERVAVLIGAIESRDGGVVFLHPPLFGHYADYGDVDLIDPADGDAAVNALRGVIAYRPPTGKYGEVEIEPPKLTWESFTAAAFGRRLVLKDDWDDKQESETRKLIQRIREAHENIEIRQIADSVVGVTLDYSQSHDDVDLTSCLGEGWASTRTMNDRKAAFLIHRMPGDLRSSFGLAEEKKYDTHVCIYHIRYDVWDKLLASVDHETMELAHLLKKVRDDLNPTHPNDLAGNAYKIHLRSQPLRQSYDHSCRLNYIRDHSHPIIVARQLAAIPEGSPVEDFIPYVQITDAALRLRKLHIHLNPTSSDRLGSQIAYEDWEAQGDWHKGCHEIVYEAVRAYDAEYSGDVGEEGQ